MPRSHLHQLAVGGWRPPVSLSVGSKCGFGCRMGKHGAEELLLAPFWLVLARQVPAGHHCDSRTTAQCAPESAVRRPPLLQSTDSLQAPGRHDHRRRVLSTPPARTSTPTITPYTQAASRLMIFFPSARHLPGIPPSRIVYSYLYIRYCRTQRQGLLVDCHPITSPPISPKSGDR